jgi:hypothetical protein
MPTQQNSRIGDRENQTPVRQQNTTTLYSDGSFTTAASHTIPDKIKLMKNKRFNIHGLNDPNKRNYQD